MHFLLRSACLCILFSALALSGIFGYKTKESRRPSSYLNKVIPVVMSTPPPPGDHCVYNLLWLLFGVSKESKWGVEEFYKNSICFTEMAKADPTGVRCLAEFFASFTNYPVHGSRSEQRKAETELRKQAECVKKELPFNVQDLFKNEYEENESESLIENLDKKEEMKMMGRNLIECLAYHFNATFSFNVTDKIKEKKELRNYGLRWNAACIEFTKERAKRMIKYLSKAIQIVDHSERIEDIFPIARDISREYSPVDIYGPALNVIRNISKLFVSVYKQLPNDPEIKITKQKFNDIKVVVFEPVKTTNQPRPALMFFHGGGWVFRGVDDYFPQAYYLAKKLRAVVVLVDYRQSPKYQFPVPVEDCMNATRYLMENSEDFNVNPNRIGVIGDSAGGNMAASVSLMLRDKKLRAPKVQVLIYPCIQLFDFNLPAYQENKEMYGLYKMEMIEFYLIYSGLNVSLRDQLSRNDHVCPETVKEYSKIVDLDGIPDEFRHGYERNQTDCYPELENTIKDIMVNSYIYPLMERNLKNLPQTLIVNNEFDILRDEGLMYGHRLNNSNVPVENYVLKGGFHGSIDLLNYAKISTEVMDHIAEYLKKNL